MTLVEGTFLVLAYKHLNGINYIKAGVTFRDILPYELAVYAFLMIGAHLIALTPEKKHYNFVNRFFIIHTIVMFYLISYRFCTFGNFINGIIVVIYNNYLKFKSGKWNLWFHFFVVKVCLINYNLNIEG